MWIWAIHLLFLNISMPPPENTHCKGKDHCTASLQSTRCMSGVVGRSEKVTLINLRNDSEEFNHKSVRQSFFCLRQSDYLRLEKININWIVLDNQVKFGALYHGALQQNEMKAQLVNQIWLLPLSLSFYIFINTTAYHWADTILQLPLASRLNLSISWQVHSVNNEILVL